MPIINNQPKEEKEYRSNYPKYSNIKEYDLNFKSPILKNNTYRWGYRNRHCKYFIKIREENLHKILNNGKEGNYIERNEII